MLESLTFGSPLLLALAALAGIAVVVTAIKFAIKVAIRLGVVAAIVLAGLYTVGVIG